MNDLDWKKAVTDAWNSLADAYDAITETGADYYRTAVMGPALLAAVGTVRGLKALDLGCGQGYFSRLLAKAGAAVTGVDISERQIANARRRETADPLGIEYHALDAAEIATLWPTATFDLVVSCITLQDMPNPLKVMQGAKLLLKPEGRSVMLIEHPTNATALRDWERDASGRKLALRIDRYFETGPRQASWTVTLNGVPRSFQFPSWSRTVEEWSSIFAGAGFLIARLIEPRPTREQVEQIPDLDDCSRIPYFLIFDLVSKGT